MIRALLLFALLIPQAFQPVGGITKVYTASGVAFVRATTVASANPAADISVSFGSLPAAGHTIVVAGRLYSDDFTGCTDNQGNGAYSLYLSEPQNAGERSIEVWYKDNIGSPSGTFTVTCDPVGATAYMGLVAIELSGVNHGGPIRDGGGSNETNTANLANTLTDGTASVSGDMAIGAAMIGGGDGAVGWGANANTGYTQAAVRSDDFALTMDYKALVSGGSQTVAWIHDSTNSPGVGWAAIIVVFAGS